MGERRSLDPESFLVRAAAGEDLPIVCDIYAHYVLRGVATFEEVPPDLEEMGRRHSRIVGLGLPFLVAEEAGTVIGYAYAAPFRGRPAYRYTLEDSVYVASGSGGRGVGTALLAELIRRCNQLGYRQMIAVIGDLGNTVSVELHRKLGFVHAGSLSAVGFKLGRWVGTVYMQRALGAGSATAPPPSAAAGR
jgi:L-amino acid N-acyltransferase YncA